MKKLAHISIFWAYQAGIINKLENLAQSCIENNISIDFILITTNKNELKNIKFLKIYYIKNIGNIFQKRKRQIDILNQISKDYYKIIMRYPLFDPIIFLFLKSKKKYIFEHHTKEIEELKLKKDKRYLFEKYLGSRWLNLFGGIIGVTKEIENYEIKRSNFKGFHTFIPNSINIGNKILQGKIYDDNIINIIMVANFRPWHGLEMIIDKMIENKQYQGKYNFYIIGEVKNNRILEKINKYDYIKYYGQLNKNKIEKLYTKMDIGLGAFNVNIKGLRETTTLKVREYFSNGLLVYIGDTDSAFPHNFKYLKQNLCFSLDDLFKFVFKYKKLDKNSIKEEAKRYIDSQIILNRLYKEIIKD